MFSIDVCNAVTSEHLASVTVPSDATIQFLRGAVVEALGLKGKANTALFFKGDLLKDADTIWTAGICGDARVDALLSSSTLAVVGDYDRTASIVNVDTGECQQTLRGHEGPVLCVQFSIDKEIVITGSADNTARVWDAATGQCRHVLNASRYALEDVSGVCLSPDGLQAVTCNSSCAALWDVASGQRLAVIGDDDGPGGCVDANFAPDGSMVVVGYRCGMLRIYRMGSTDLQQTMEGHTGVVKSACFSPCTKTVLTGSEDSTARLWSVETGKSKLTLSPASGTVESACFSPDGLSVVTAHTDKCAILWGAETGERLWTYHVSDGALTSVCFSSDGTLMLTGCCGGPSKLWCVRSGECVREFRCMKNRVNRCYIKLY